MPLIQSLLSTPVEHPITLPVFVFALLAILAIYRLCFHPLAHIPGPFLARISSLYLYVVCFRGIECRTIARWHAESGQSVIRVGPNSVSISDGSALHGIYVEGGGFKKDDRYDNFKVDGHATIFSTRDATYRDVRAKAVLPLFAMGRIRAAGEPGGIIRKSVDQFIDRFRTEKENAARPKHPSTTVDLLDLSERLAIDVVTGYLFNKPYGGLSENLSNTIQFSEPNWQRNHMSATPFILAIVAFGRFSLLPNWLFMNIFSFASLLGRLFPDPDATNSFGIVHAFSSSLVEPASTEKKHVGPTDSSETVSLSTPTDTYQSRLLAAGISPEETAAQCKAVTFAGTDSTAVKLATILFHLTQHPLARDRLAAESSAAGAHSDPQTLPFLRAVVKEGLRIGMSNPARSTRIVPRGGMTVGDVFVPEGAVVGLSPWILHHNEKLFDDPWSFKPQRWMDEEDGKNYENRKSQMERDVIPFSIGLRACLARNLATYELSLAIRAVVDSGVLDGAKTHVKEIELHELFNVAIKGHRLEIEWPA